MKIAYLIPGCGVSGGIAVICQHANRLLARGYDVLLVSDTPETNLDWFPKQKVKAIILDDYPDDIDVLVATAWSTAFKVAGLNAARKCYFVQSDETRFHDSNSPWEHITRLSYLMDYEFFTEARWIQRWLLENFAQTAALVPNGLDPEIYHPARPLVSKGHKTRVLLEGAIGLSHKGMKQAFEAVSELDVEIWCVSSYGRPEPGWRCDRFFESVPMGEMKHIYSSCDILLKMSRVEGFFGPPMEMMACGGAVVVGKVTGYDEYIVDGVNALVVDPLDVSAAKAAVLRLIENKDLHGRLIQNGKQTAENWQWESSIDKLEHIINNPLSKRVSKPQDSSRINQSVAFFYWRLVSGQLPSVADGTPAALDSEISHNDIVAEKLCRELKKQSWFYPLAKMVYGCYWLMVKLRGRLSAVHLWYLSKPRRLLAAWWRRIRRQPR